MIINSTATNSDWVWQEIDIADDRADEYYTLLDTPELYTFFQQGVSEGWITVIG
jgi:hypothetical protein